jgi:hypothetical protein
VDYDGVPAGWKSLYAFRRGAASILTQLTGNPIAASLEIFRQLKARRPGNESSSCRAVTLVIGDTLSEVSGNRDNPSQRR